MAVMRVARNLICPASTVHHALKPCTAKLTRTDQLTIASGAGSSLEG